MARPLVVVDIDDTNTIKSFLNLPEVQLIETRELNAYDVLCSDYVVFSHATLSRRRRCLSPARPPRRQTAKKAPAGRKLPPRKLLQQRRQRPSKAARESASDEPQAARKRKAKRTTSPQVTTSPSSTRFTYAGKCQGRG